MFMKKELIGMPSPTFLLLQTFVLKVSCEKLTLTRWSVARFPDLYGFVSSKWVFKNPDQVWPSFKREPIQDLSFLSNFKKSICPGLIFLEVLKGHLTSWDGVGSAHHRDLSQLQDFLSQRIFTVFIRFIIRFLLDSILIIVYRPCPWLNDSLTNVLKTWLMRLWLLK